MRVPADAAGGGTARGTARSVAAVAIEPGMERVRAGTGQRLCTRQADALFDNTAE
ncbi:MAG TPA: hypothetical protein VHU15_04430 [Stellaceae bacterium]|jgi:hypothetical protein|nr:hypothetical protein [Stellaceae bacterium]